MRLARRLGSTLHRSAALLRMVRRSPPALLGRFSRLVARRSRWIDRAALRMEALLPGPVVELGASILRRLRPGARPIADGFVAPVDGVVISAGPIPRGMLLHVKGVALDLGRLTRGADPEVPLLGHEGGRYTTISLPSRGPHSVHMPIPATLLEVRWIAGPQKLDERDERAILRCRSDDGHEFLLVLVGASIHLAGIEPAVGTRREPVRCERRCARGVELGHFSLGAVLVLVPPALAGLPPFIGTELRMGQRLW